MRQVIGWSAVAVFVVAGWGLAEGPATRPATTRPDPRAALADLPAYVNKALADWGMPNMAVAVVVGDEVVFCGGFGVRKLGAPEKVDEHTRFQIGSCTKAFTAALAAILIDHGKLAGWDERLVRLLPDFQLYDPWVTQACTIRDLLCHRSGLPDQGGTLLMSPLGYTRPEMVRRVSALPQAAPFRTTFLYNNLGYVTVGEAQAAAAGVTWDDLLRTRILQPVGMTRSGARLADITQDANAATAHADVDGKLVPIPYNLGDVGAAGSIVSCAADMARWVRVLVNEGELDGRRIVSAEHLRETFAPAITRAVMGPEQMAGATADGRVDLSMGWYNRNFRGQRLVGASGGIDGMSTLVQFLPAAKIGVFTTFSGPNSHTAMNNAVQAWILDRLLGEAPRDWSAEALAQYRSAAAVKDAADQAEQAQLDAGRVRGSQPTLPPERYAGLYRSPLWGEARVAVEDGKLVARFGPAQVRCALAHWHQDIFKTAMWAWGENTEFFISFRVTPAGEVAGLTAWEDSVFTRVPPASQAP